MKYTVKIFGNQLFDATIASYNNKNIEVSYSAQATVDLDNQNRLTADIEDVDLSWSGLLPGAPDFLLAAVINWIIESIIEGMPPITLSPPLISMEIPNTQLALHIHSAKLTVTDDEAIVKANLRIKGFEKYLSPLYIANRNRACLEVHKSDCVWVGKMLEKHKVPYWFLDEAHEDGYDNCYYCIGDSKR